MISSLLLAVTIVAQSAGYYTSLARHLERWLGQEGVPAKVVTTGEMRSSLQNEKIAFLLGFDQVSSATLATLKDFRANGGKLVVFYSSSRALADLMDVEILGFASAPKPGAWSQMRFAAKTPAGLPTLVRQTSTVLLRARPKAGRGRVLATWEDRLGQSSGEAALVATTGGFWMTHVLLADGDEDLKAQLVGALVGAVDPKAWSLAAHQAREAARKKAWRDLARRQTTRAGEIHAVWDHSGCGLYPGDWPRTMAVLRNAGVTDLFVNVAGAGFAHYPSRVLPRSKIFREEGDQLKACLAAAKGTGIRVHAWILAFSATRAAPAQLKVYEQKGWRLKTTQGVLTEYLDPMNPEVRALVLKAIDEIQQTYPVAGIHLDFVRWGDGVAKPKNAASELTSFMVQARRRVKRPKWLTAAVYGKHPHCVATVGQDWKEWLDLGLVDYAVPMNYTSSLAKFRELLRDQTKERSHAKKLIVGVGVTANESRLHVDDVIEQIRLSRQAGVAGNALFDLDVTLEKNILPFLRLGLW